MEIHRHWLAEADETPKFVLFHSDHRSDDHLANSANWMTQSKFHHSLSETDPDSAVAVAVLASSLDVIVADAEQGSAERLVDSPI